MKKRRFLAIFTTFISISLFSALEAGYYARSSYIGKSWMSFEMNNGPSFKWKKFKDGSSIQYWRSDLAGCCTGRYYSGIENLCYLVIKVDSRKVIRSIKVIEDGSACIFALK
jgi:hypothetical protein